MPELNPDRIRQIEQQLAVLEPKAAQAQEPFVREALLSRIQQLRSELGEPQTILEESPTPEPIVAEPVIDEPFEQPEPSTEYHVATPAGQLGPLTLETLRERLRSGQIGTEALFWTQGKTAWVPLSDFPELQTTPPPANLEPPTLEPATPEPRTPAPTTKKRRPEDDVILPPAATPQQIADSDELLRQSRVMKMRGSTTEAERLLNQALQIAPGAPNVLEAQGDAFREKGNRGEARLAYYKAHRMAPKVANYERKYAEMVFSAGVSMSFETARLYESESLASNRAATIFSAIVPGAGQLVLEDYKKGGIFLGVWVLSVAGLILFRKDTSNLIGMLGHKSGPVSPLLWVVLLIFFGNWVASLMDCLSRSKSSQIPTLGSVTMDAAEKKKREHPVPPVNLPFE